MFTDGKFFITGGYGRDEAESSFESAAARILQRENEKEAVNNGRICHSEKRSGGDPPETARVPEILC